MNEVGINVTKARIPVVFELSNDSDSRFKKVKVWIAHTGENLNNSYFSKETLEEMSKTLPKIPIVGYIEVDSDGDNDFSDHRQEIVIKSGEGVDIRYAGHAYGFLPEESNAKFEIRDGKEWLTAEGYIWTKFKDAIEIFNEESGTKPHSMEIIEAEGEVDDIGRMVVSSAVFSALCILGEDVSPAMTGSTVEFYSEKKNQYQFELNEMLEEFEREKGELDLPKTNEELENIEDTSKDESKDVNEDLGVEEPKSAEGEPENAENPELEPNEDTAVAVEPETEGGEPESDEEGMFSINEETNTVSINFQLSHDDQRYGLYKRLEERIENGYHYVLDMYNDHAIVEQVSFDEDYENREEKILLVNFTSDNNEVEVGEVEEVFPMYLTQSEKTAVDTQREEIKTLNGRLEELSEYRDSTELDAKESLVSEYAEELEEEIVETIRDNFSTMSVEEVEKEVALQFFKKAQAEKHENGVSVSVQNFSKAKEQRYGSLDKYFM